MSVTTFLIDCDGTLVQSEELAFAGCCAVVNETLAGKGVSKQFTPAELMSRFVGRSFRGMITELASEHAFLLEDDELNALVLEEENRVIQILTAQVEPTRGVNEVLTALTGKYVLAVVSSSALRRVRACLVKAGQDGFFPADQVYSAATSLSPPSSKPDPAIYLHALQCLRVTAAECIAVEDSRSGVLAAVRAGIPVVGYVGSFPEHEQDERARTLAESGAALVVRSWDQFIPALSRLESACKQ